MNEPVKTILIVDDDAAIRSFIRRILESRGYRVIEAEDGRKGLDAFRAERPDLVLLDLYMPEKDGLETLRDLRMESSPPKVVTMSGGGPKYDVTILQSARFLGAQYSLVKPFSIGELTELVAAVLKGTTPDTTARPAAGG